MFLIFFVGGECLYSLAKYLDLRGDLGEEKGVKETL